MTPLAEIIELTPAQEADRLWTGARAAFAAGEDDFVALVEALDLGLRAAEILVVQRLQSVKGGFPATVQLMLELPDPEVDVQRDATHIPATLDFTAALDLLSAEDLDCVSPGLHRGWEDRRFSCTRSRGTAAQALGVSLGAEERDRLLALAAYRNRVFRCPPPLRIQRREIVDAWQALEGLMEALSR